MYNDTISNPRQGVHVNAESTADTSGESPMQVILLNNTFYNDANGVQTISPGVQRPRTCSPTSTTLAMNNIFDGSTITAVDIEGKAG